jgi:hypothetical protein
MGLCLIISHPDDLIARTLYDVLSAAKRPVAALTRWSDVQISFGYNGVETVSSLILMPARQEIPLQDLSLVFYRGGLAVHSRLPRRTQQYAQDEWQSALSIVTALECCPVLNSPFPDRPNGEGYMTTNSGRRLALARKLGIATPRGRISNIEAPLPGAPTFGAIANGPGDDEALEQARLGLELLSSKPLRRADVPLFWVVGGSVIVQKALDLDSGTVTSATFGEECVRFAEECARACDLAFGTLWLFPDEDGGWLPGGYDRFPPQQYLDGSVTMVAIEVSEFIRSVPARRRASSSPQRLRTEGR